MLLTKAQMIQRHIKTPSLKTKGGEMIMSVDSRPGDLRDACERTTSLYSEWSAEAARQEIRAWAVTPELQGLTEMCEFQAASIGNPAKFWVYTDKDLVGWVATLAGSRGGANTSAPSAAKVLNRCRACVTELCRDHQSMFMHVLWTKKHVTCVSQVRTRTHTFVECG